MPFGFEQAFESGDPVFFASVCRGAVTIHLQSAEAADRPKGTSCISIFVGDALAIHSELIERGAQIRVPPAERDCELIDFGIEDPDGNELVFGSPLAES
jgi:hypothetical protein